MSGGKERPETVIFDLGGVLIDWDPRYLYRKLFEDEGEMERFLAEVCNRAWIEEQDAGRPFAQGVEALSRRHPHYRAEIEAFWTRWPEMLSEPIHGTVELLAALKADGLRLYALSNWSAETWPHATDRFEFLNWFDGLVVSGLEGIKKPDPAIYALLLERHAIDPASALFIDDVPVNVEAGRSSGIASLRFQDAPALKEDLVGYGLLTG